MNFINFIKNGSWKGAFQGVGMKLGQARPEILLITGGISLLAGTIYACTKTEEAKEVIAEAKEKAEVVEQTLSLAPPEGIDIMPETLKQLKMERGKQYFNIYGSMVYKLVKIYGVSALLWFGGLGLVVGGHTDLRHMNKSLVADILAGKQMFQEYRDRVAKAVGEETEQKIYLGAQEGRVQVLEKDPLTGEEKLVEKEGTIFADQPGSIFAINFNEDTSDAFDIRSFADHYLDARIDSINKQLEVGMARAFNGFEIYRMLGIKEDAFGDNDHLLEMLLRYGISGNARKVPDPEMRKLKITRMRGYRLIHDAARGIDYYEPCLRIDPNFYPLEGKI